MNGPRSTEWMTGALCAQVGGGPFFPGKGGTSGPAKRVCRACPVRAECLAYALAEGLTHGVWGGMSPNERRAIAAQTTAVGASALLATQAMEGIAA